MTSPAFVGDLATLEGGNSFDPDGDALNYLWSLVSAPVDSIAALADATGPIAQFTPDRRGSYEFALVVSDYELSSTAAHVTLEVPNRSPDAVLEGAQSGLVNEQLMFSAAGSSDPDNDPLSFTYALVLAPEGSQAILSATGNSATLTPDLAGDYIVEVTVSDGLASTTARAELSARRGNGAPILHDLRSVYTVEVGLELALDLSATDPDGDPLTFFATPLPLPDGVTLDARSGALRFRPEERQHGNYTLTLGVSDGTQTDRADITIEVVPGSAGDTAIHGRVLDAVDFAQGISTPLAGVPVRLKEAALATVTDAAGNFSFGSLEAGADTVFIEPGAQGGPGGYVGATRAIRITLDQDRDLSPDFLLTPLNDGCADVAAGADTVLTGTSGVRVTIPADTIEDAEGAAYEGQVCLGSLPRLFAQDGLPEGSQACQIYALDAPGAVFTAPMTISAPNHDALPEATKLTFWQMPGRSASFLRTASASVANGASDVTASDVSLSPGALFTFLPQLPRVAPSADQPVGYSQTSVFTGDNSLVYGLAGYRAFNQNQQISLAYHSQSAAPRPIVAGDVAIAADASLPVALNGRLDIGGLNLSDGIAWNPRMGADGSTPALVGEALTMRHSMPVDATGLASGRYSYRFTALAQYACSTVAAGFDNEMHVLNTSESAFGDGWSVEGLQELVESPDGSVSIVTDDRVTTFDLSPTLSDFVGDPQQFPASGVQGLAVADLDGDGRDDIVWGDSGTGRIGFVWNKGNGAFAQSFSEQVAEPNEVPEDLSQPLAPNLRAVAVIDLNLDGQLDIAFGTQLEGRVDFLINQGNGEFLLQPGRYFESYARTDYIRDLKVSDIDNDGHDDLVIGSIYAGGFGRYDFVWIVRASGGTPEFTKIYHHTGQEMRQLMLGDIDNNGFVDIGSRGYDDFTFLNNEDGTNFEASYPSLMCPMDKALGEYAQLADVNEDGNLDLLVSAINTVAFCPGRPTPELRLYLGNGDRTFAPVDVLFRFDDLGLPSTGFIFALDVDGDSHIDIVSNTDEGLAVFRGHGDGSFDIPEIGSLPYQVQFLDLGDLDSNDSLDLVTAQRFSVTLQFSTDPTGRKLVPGPGEFSTLNQLDDGSWQRLYKDGSSVEFNADGLQTAQVDTNGNRRSFAYDAQGRLVTITDQVGGETVFTYDDATGMLVSIAYPDGRVTSFEMDADGNLGGVSDAETGKVSFAYDEDGRLVSSINQNGNETAYSYDATGRLSGAEMADGSSVSTRIAAALGIVDGLGNLTPSPRPYVAPGDRVSTVTDRKGGITTIEVNEYGATVRIVDPLGRETRIERDGNNLVRRVERPDDSITGGIRVDTLSYDTFGNLSSHIEARGTAEQRSIRYRYETKFNKVIAKTDGDGYVTGYSYDDAGNLLSITDPEGGVQAFTYTGQGQTASRTDANGNATHFAYDADLNLSEITYPDGSITHMTYDPAGNTSVVAEAVGTPEERQVHRVYDGLNRVTQTFVTDSAGTPVGGLTRYGYDGVGNLTEVVDGTGLVTAMGYDALERLVSVDDPAEGLIRRTYNAAGEVTEHINGDGEVNRYTYDAVSRLTSTTDPAGYAKSFAYDSRDNVTTVTDGRGGVTGFTYDALGRMVSRTNPIGEVMTRAYDPRDNLTELTREDGTVEVAIYDGLGRRIQVITPDNTLSYAYDANGNLTAAADDDSRVTFTYDARNRLATTTTDGSVGPQPQVTLSYGYDALDRRLSMSDDMGGVTQYAWDGEDRLSTLTAPWGTSYSFGYDADGRRTSLNSSSGRASTWSYADGLLTGLTHAQSGVALSDLVYSYDPDGQLTAIVDNLDPSKSKEISYDALNRLVQVDEGVPADQGGVPIPVEDYAYDAEGNRTASHLSGVYSSNAFNQLLEDDSYRYAYDAKGNRISRTSKADGAVERYAYDSQNRLVGYANAELSARYAYDALDRRIAKVLAGPDAAIEPLARASSQALQLAGEEVDIPDIALDGPFTIEAWIKFDGWIENIDALLRSPDGQPYQNLNFAGARLRLYDPAISPQDKIIATTAAQSGVWAHYALTRDATGALKLYVNGALDATGYVSFTETLRIGYLGVNTTRGSFDDVRIWTVARTGAQIAADKSANVDPASPGLERLYRFDGDADAIRDFTGKSSATPLPANDSLIASDAPVAPDPAPVVPYGAGAEVTAYVYDIAPENPLAYDDVVLEYSGGALVRRWLHSTAVDEPVGFEEYTNTSGVGSGAERAMFADRQGSVIWVTEPATGAVVAGYEYSGYGVPLQVQGTLKQPYGYTGREYDAESGLYHYRARAYDPAAGVFMQVDPIEFGGEQANLFAYTKGNPIEHDDPSGLSESSTYASSSVVEEAGDILSQTYLFAGIGAASGQAIRLIGNAGSFLDFGIETSVNSSGGKCSAAMVAEFDALKPHTKECENGSANIWRNLTNMREIQYEIFIRMIELNACWDGGLLGSGFITNR